MHMYLKPVSCLYFIPSGMAHNYAVVHLYKVPLDEQRKTSTTLDFINPHTEQLYTLYYKFFLLHWEQY